LNDFEDIEIYGGEDCLINLYEKGDAVEDILENFEKEKETSHNMRSKTIPRKELSSTPFKSV